MAKASHKVLKLLFDVIGTDDDQIWAPNLFVRQKHRRQIYQKITIRIQNFNNKIFEVQNFSKILNKVSRQHEPWYAKQGQHYRFQRSVEEGATTMPRRLAFGLHLLAARSLFTLWP